jgi:indoleamine 2,3-dioxygenase
LEPLLKGVILNAGIRFDLDLSRGPNDYTFMRRHSNLKATDDETEGLARETTIDEIFRKRGFLPEEDPLTAFPSDSEFAMLDEIGRDLPRLLRDRGFRQHARALKIPLWPKERARPEDLRELRLYYVRVGFLVSAYVNQVGQEPVTVLPANLALPLCRACHLLERPPILSYDGYALYNWKRFRKDQPIALGNIDTIQNFVHLYDEHWFILVHVEIEALAARILDAIAKVQVALSTGEFTIIDQALWAIASAVTDQVKVLRRIPEKMDPALYYKTFRPYIRFFENVFYEATEQRPIADTSPRAPNVVRMNFRGETGAQSSIMPTLVAFMKIPHKPSMLTNHLADMRQYMPAQHRQVIEAVERMPSIRELADHKAYNAVLDATAEFRTVHYGWAQEYINRRTDDPRGTGGTPYMEWLQQLIEETRGFKIA